MSAKPLIEDVIPAVLDGGMKDAALEFCAYLRANKMKPVWSVTNGWKAMHGKKAILYIRLATDDWKTAKHLSKKYSKHSWVVTLFIERNLNKYQDAIMQEGLQDFVWENVHHCMACRSPCHGMLPPHRDVTVLGKEIKRLCHSRELTWVFDPDAAAIEKIKKLIALEIQAREGNAATV